GGMILINGEPPTGALLSLHPVSGEPFDQRNTRPYAKVDGLGRFVLTTYETGDGAPEGEYFVTVDWPPDPDDPSPQPDRLGGRLSDSKNSELKVTVVPDDADLGTLALDDVPLLPADITASPDAGNGPPDGPR
ncbi:MAG: hypothetical protein AAF907_04175, partial [Planctomycetota bacterium]